MEPVIKKTSAPLGANKSASRLSISSAFYTPETAAEEKAVVKETLPSNHFTETDLQEIWKAFLNDLQERDMIIYSAIHAFKMRKKDEDTIEVTYPSDSAKTEFEQIRAEFFNHFMHKVNHFNIEVQYVKDVTLKKEVVTKRNIFDKFVEINPLLRDLDDIFKFDFS